MGSLADRIAAQEAPENVGTLELGSDGGEFTGVRFDAPVKDLSDILRKLNVDPDTFEVDGDTVRVSSWQQSKRTENGDRDVITLYSYSGRIKPRRDAIDLPALYAAAGKRLRARVKPSGSGRVTVVALADVQAGKVGSRGGTPELVERLTEKREALESFLTARRPSRTVLAECGDLFEGFESGGNPMRTNDLSLAQQMDLAGTELFKFLALMHRFGPVDVVAVPSNHTAWRKGKQMLGTPGDDLGLFVHRQVQRLAETAGMDVTWTVPAEFDESVALDVNGTVLGLAHGNQFGPGGAKRWWADQVHGGQPVGRADILLTGHYHHLTVLPTGRNPYTGRSKWWLQAPTVDNGSDWFRNKAGDDSDPGLLVFEIGPDGFDLQSLTVL